MHQAVQLSAYGGIEELRIEQVETPEPLPGQVVVRVIAAGLNPGEISIREGMLQAMFPRAFPFGQGTDYAGIVSAIGTGVSEFAVGDEVLGWSDERSAQAQYVVGDVSHVIAKPPTLDWYRAGGLFVVATTAVAGVRALALRPGDTVAVSGAAGGVGCLAIQLARRAGARVLGIASAANADFLGSVGVEHVPYGDGLQERLQARAPEGITAFLDLYGEGYVELALALGIPADRINTIIDFAAAQRHGVKSDGSSAASDRSTLASIANLVAWGEVLLPIAAVYPFAALTEAYQDLARRKARGKIVLSLDEKISAVQRPPG